MKTRKSLLLRLIKIYLKSVQKNNPSREEKPNSSSLPPIKNYPEPLDRKSL